MNIENLYNDNVCKLCGFEGREHDDDCIGRLAENVSYEVVYSGPNCGRGCCGYTDGTGTGATLDAAIEDAADSLARSEAIRWSVDARIVVCLGDIDDRVKALVTKMREDREAEERGKRDAATRAYNLAALEKERADLTPEAYERRLAAINGTVA